MFTDYPATAARIEVDWPPVRHTEGENAMASTHTMTQAGPEHPSRSPEPTAAQAAEAVPTERSPMFDAVPLTQVSTEDATAWHAVVSASLAADLPEEPLPTFEQTHARLSVTGRHDRRLLWLATDSDGAVVGVAGLRLFTSPGQRHLAELELHVTPDRRRSGVGSHLLATAVRAARDEERRSLVAAAPGDGPAGAFCLARGFRRVLALDHLLLDVADADVEQAGTEHPGYTLVGWTGTVPDELAEAFASVKNAMNDMPMGDMDYGSQNWTADRVRAMAEVLADRGDLLLTTAVLDKGGEMAGYTEIVIRSGETRRALQYDTVVAPAHRGHGLGLWVKTEMVRRLREERPGIEEIETDNAQENTHMIAVNRRLGFRFHRSTHEYQLDLPTE